MRAKISCVLVQALFLLLGKVFTAQAQVPPLRMGGQQNQQGAPPAGNASAFSIRDRIDAGCVGRINEIDVQAQEVFNRVRTSACIKTEELRAYLIQAFRSMRITCPSRLHPLVPECGDTPYSSLGTDGMIHSGEVALSPMLGTLAGRAVCPKIASVLLHEAVHLTQTRRIGNLEQAPRGCEQSCYGDDPVNWGYRQENPQLSPNDCVDEDTLWARAKKCRPGMVAQPMGDFTWCREPPGKPRR